MSRLRNITFAALFAALAFAFAHTATAATGTDAASVARGRYIARIAGCNDCHTAGYAPSGGKVPEKDWLMGDALGWTYVAWLLVVAALYVPARWLADLKARRRDRWLGYL